ncbi:ribonuclease P protein component [Bellilinea caldifistulae]|uniref:ribonuclease P protein component n=1 Tax=Bellilinea caldifistulae TaxID=360411 RepID=UPI0007813410|nr:ribonuclease P protein component [Bellilinea caldifistulae]GAP11342.1 ribonuclease P protein component [Bellilinea caldifistulae]
MPLGRDLPFIGLQWTDSWVKRKFRLRRSNDFKRVRQSGKSFTHPFVVLSVLSNEEGQLRIGITASKAVGSAVDRNRAKRRLRAVVDGLLPRMQAGWDVVLIARKPVLTADFEDLTQSVLELLTRAHVIVENGTRFDDRA